MEVWLSKLKQKLLDREQQNSLRRLEIDTPQIDFYSNDYLGLSTMSTSTSFNHSKGSGGSRLIAGNSVLHETLEKELAQFHEAPSALLFNSGFDANLALLSTLPQKGDTIVYDELSHSSIRQGIRLSVANSYKFKHNDLNALKQRLIKGQGQLFIVVESIYSMDGDMANVKKMHQLALEYNAILIIDEAHSNGILGKRGEGIVSFLQQDTSNVIRMMGFGKAIGRHGAVVLSNETIKSYLINFAPSFIYTTALPEESIAAVQEAYQQLKNRPELQHQLNHNIAHFQQSTKNLKGVTPSDSPIQAIIIEGNHSVKKVATQLLEEGINIKPILYPTVPKGEERIRICLHAFNTTEEIDKLVKILKDQQLEQQQ